MRSLGLMAVSAITRTALSSALATFVFFTTAHASPIVDPVSQDIWTTSVYSYGPGGGGPGGGLADGLLRVGGWGDLYYSLLKFDVSQSPANATSAIIQLYDTGANGGTSTPMNLFQINSPWDWTTMGTGSDHNRLWWADQPSVSLIGSNLPAPTVGSYYSIDITALYNAWKSGVAVNEGVELQPLFNNNNFNQFASSRNLIAATAPVLIINGPQTPVSLTMSQLLALKATFPSPQNIVVLPGSDPAYGMTYDAWLARLQQAADERNATGVQVDWTSGIPVIWDLGLCTIALYTDGILDPWDECSKAPPFKTLIDQLDTQLTSFEINPFFDLYSGSGTVQFQGVDLPFGVGDTFLLNSPFFGDGYSWTEFEVTGNSISDGVDELSFSITGFRELPEAVAEPATITLVSFGLAGFFFLYFRRTRKKNESAPRSC